jgi:hypothetical protein
MTDLTTDRSRMPRAPRFRELSSKRCKWFGPLHRQRHRWRVRARTGYARVLWLAGMNTTTPSAMMSGETRRASDARSQRQDRWRDSYAALLKGCSAGHTPRNNSKMVAEVSTGGLRRSFRDGKDCQQQVRSQRCFRHSGTAVVFRNSESICFGLQNEWDKQHLR